MFVALNPGAITPDTFNLLIMFLILLILILLTGIMFYTKK